MGVEAEQLRIGTQKRPDERGTGEQAELLVLERA
jgi:hypothetical protein